MIRGGSYVFIVQAISPNVALFMNLILSQKLSQSASPLRFYQGSLCSSSVACPYKTVGYYHGYQWFLVSQLQKFLGFCGATTLGLYRAMTILLYGSSNRRLYNSTITNIQIRNSMALQLYNAMTLRFYGTLGLYGSTALWLYSSVITTLTLRLYGSTAL